METRTFFTGAGDYSCNTLDILRRVIDDYNFAAKLQLTVFDIYAIVGLADPNYSVDQAVYDYLHSDSCPDCERKQRAYSEKTLRCDISVLAILRNAYCLDGHLDGGWADKDGNFWPTDELVYDRGDRKYFEELAIKRWRDEQDMTAEEADIHAVSDVVAYCWQGRKSRHMCQRYLWEFIPKGLVARSQRDQIPSPEQLVADAGFTLSEED